ncbi:cupin domain-containing protein [Noviherbaspirillum denitrificans]|uniref:Cupin n=1 Tax=Noviherbaspirillum denitrificans TaxID=1968433 RepID=A0A254TM18_9BURK|nr:cupin domain-containing protein [Noviherbaspirillum denitrificans]OWW21663.1 cupin [Noviherbaspirillum denitrificans]
MDRDAFVALLAQEGFKELVTVEREPDGGLDTHTHPFEAKALILDGEIRIVCGSAESVYGPGDIFHLMADEPHTEYYGPRGVRYLVGRRQDRESPAHS